MILADDMGFSDARCYGGDIDTPNLDRLAAGGLRFTQAYSTARCGPSRSCLLTGYYAQQTASDVMTPGKIPSLHAFLPEYLKPLGYRSYHSGKWHMRFVDGQGRRGLRPLLHHARRESASSPRTATNSTASRCPSRGEGYYSTTAIADYGVRFLKEHARDHAQDPFFLYLAFHSPHFPLQAPADDIAALQRQFAEGWDTARERKWRACTAWAW